MNAEQLIQAVDDVHGLTVSVYRDHDGVRIEVGGQVAMLDYYGASRVMEGIDEARTDGLLWQTDEVTGSCHVCHAPRGFTCSPAVPGPIVDGRHVSGRPASCGHPANEDGECSCSSWPERAPLTVVPDE